MDAEVDRPLPLPPNPITGEVLDLRTAADVDLASWLDAVRGMEQAQRAAKKVVQDELLRRMDRNASYTIREGDFQITGDSPKPQVHYDVEPLAADLDELVRGGLLTEEARARVIVETVERKVSQREVNKLLNLGGPVAEAVERHRTEAPRDRRVRVKRA